MDDEGCTLGEVKKPLSPDFSLSLPLWRRVYLLFRGHGVVMVVLITCVSTSPVLSGLD